MSDDRSFLKHVDLPFDHNDEASHAKDIEITYIILNILSKRIHTEVSPEMKYAELQIDSLVFMTIILDIEKEFEISIHNDDLEKFKTVQDTINYVNRIVHARANV